MIVKSQESRVKSQKFDFGFRISDFGFRIEVFRQSAIRNPQSPRRGISLTEVLIAMGILTLGLLGVAALFPVGGFYMQKAEIADRGAAIGQAVMNELVARGMLNPKAWYVMIPPQNYGKPEEKKSFPSDGRFGPSRKPVFGDYGRPFALTLGEALLANAGADPALIGKQFGSAFVIDPIGVSAMAFYNPTSVNSFGPTDWNVASSSFPSGVTTWYAGQGSWSPWGTYWPVRRVTFRQSNTGWPLSPSMSEHYFRGNDDIVAELPDRDDRPALQTWDTTNVSGSTTPLARQWTGDYSWLATVVPTTNEARNGLARNPEGHAYDVSVVVFYKRPLPVGAVSVFDSGNGKRDFLYTMGSYERAVVARVISSGLTGGELVLERLSGEPTSPFEGLRSGQWIMLCGPHPNSNYDATAKTGEPRFVMNWYQVISIEGEDRRLNPDGTETPTPPSDAPERRVVTVRGPQWPWVPADVTDATAPGNNLCVGIFPGAVAVHTKTMRLEGGSNAGMAAFGSSGNPTVDPPPWVTN